MKGRENGRLKLLFPMALVLAAMLAYANSFRGAFLFDDNIRIINDARIRSLWPIGPLLSGERPVVDISLAINYAISELNPWSYHALNLVIHILAGLTLYGIVRRAVNMYVMSQMSRQLPLSLSRRGQGEGAPTKSHTDPSPYRQIDTSPLLASSLACSIALLFLVHPLQTQSVTYVIQRGESLMGLFYLLTLYCAIRSIDSSRRLLWFIAALACCALGMASKAIMVTAPFMVILYDWVFLPSLLEREDTGGSVQSSRNSNHENPKRTSVLRRWPLYAGMCATWLVLWLVGIAQDVLGTTSQSPVGFSYKGVTPFQYAATQMGVIVKYLQLAVWPAQLCIDYAWPVATSWRDGALPAVVVLSLLLATLWLLWRRHWLGFVGAWFFVILSPTSSFVPNKDPIFEHRMYLPLAAVIAAIVLPVGLWIVCCPTRRELQCARTQKMKSTQELQGKLAILIALLGLVLAAPLAYATHLRNRTYFSELTMWQDVVAKRQANPRAHLGVGVELIEAGRPEEAIEHLRRAITLKYAYADAHFNLAVALAKTGKLAKAIPEFMETVRLNPARADALAGAAEAYGRLGDYQRGKQALLAAIQRKPAVADYQYQLGNLLLDSGDANEAKTAFEAALGLDPHHVDARINLGNIYLKQNQPEKAQAEYESVLARQPAHSTALVNLGRAFIQQSRWNQAIDVFAKVSDADPLAAEARFGAGWAWSKMNDVDRARQQYEAALRLDPDHAGAAAELARLHSQND